MDIKQLIFLDEEYHQLIEEGRSNPRFFLEDEAANVRAKELSKILQGENLGNLRYVISALIEQTELTSEEIANVINITPKEIEGLIDGTYITKKSIISLCAFFKLNLNRYIYYYNDAL